MCVVQEIQKNLGNLRGTSIESQCIVYVVDPEIDSVVPESFLAETNSLVY